MKVTVAFTDEAEATYENIWGWEIEGEFLVLYGETDPSSQTRWPAAVISSEHIFVAKFHQGGKDGVRQQTETENRKIP